MADYITDPMIYYKGNDRFECTRPHRLRVRSNVTIDQLPTQGPDQRITRLLRLCESDTGAANVIDRVPLPQERVTQDSKGTHGLGEVHAHEGRDTRSLDLEDVVEGRNGEVVSGEREGKIGQSVALVALNSVLTVERLLGTDFLVPINVQQILR